MFKKVDLKLWATVALSGVVVVAGAALVSQWKYASIGRQVSRNVLRFLIDNGARIENDTIRGGVIPMPMKISTAVNSTVSQMLDAVSKQISEHSGYGGGNEEGDNDDETDIEEGETDRTVVPSAKPGTPINGRHPPPPPIGGKPEYQQQQQQQPKPSARNTGNGSAAVSSSSSSSSPPSRLPDDGGYTSAARKPSPRDFTYNPDEFRPSELIGKKIPNSSVLFSDNEGGGGLKRQSKWQREKKHSSRRDKLDTLSETDRKSVEEEDCI